MRMLAIALVVCVLGLPAFAQESDPSADLARENARLKSRVQELEKYVEQLEAKLRAQETQKPRPPTAAPYEFKLPAVPFNQAPPRIVPPSQPRLLPPPANPPENWHRREFNGQEYYLIPLR